MREKYYNNVSNLKAVNLLKIIIDWMLSHAWENVNEVMNVIRWKLFSYENAKKGSRRLLLQSKEERRKKKFFFTNDIYYFTPSEKKFKGKHTQRGILKKWK